MLLPNTLTYLKSKEDIMTKSLTKYWWVFVLRGILAILFGLASFIYPEITLIAFLYMFAAFAFVDGTFRAGASWGIRKEGDKDWWLYLVSGAVGIAFGGFGLLNPAISAIALLSILVAWLVTLGIIEIVVAIRVRELIKGEWMLILSGILSIGLGIVFLLRPEEGALVIVWVAAAYAVIIGTVLIFLGLKIRRFSKKVERKLTSIIS